MATTKIWKIEKRLDHVVDYAKDKKKTKNDYLENGFDKYDNIRQVVMYATNADKTEKQFYATGINCDVNKAVEQMQLVKKLYGKENGILAFHAEQSFVAGEITPEMAHEVGVKLANEIWGERFQVIVTTHLNTEHLHNHFVVNSVSFNDGLRFHMCTARYMEMREVSDRLCREYDLSVIENPQGKGKAYKISKLEKAGMPTRYSVARDAINDAIKRSLTLEEFKYELKQLGFRYQFNPNRKYWTVTIPGGDKPIRIHQLGPEYTRERIMERISGNDESVRQKKYQEMYEYQPNGYNMRRRIHKINAKTGLEKLYLRVCYEMGYLPKYQQDPSRIHRLFLEDIFKCDKYAEEAKFLLTNDIKTDQELELFMKSTEEKMSELSDKRDQYRKEIKRKIPEEDREDLKEQITNLTRDLRMLRHELALSKDIMDKSKDFEEKINIIDKERYKEVEYR